MPANVGQIIRREDPARETATPALANPARRAARHEIELNLEIQDAWRS